MAECTVCQASAILSVGDSICHRMNARGEKVDCHALSGAVKARRMTVHDYVDELEKRANAQEKHYIEELKKMF